MAFTPPPTIPQRGARSIFSKAVDAFLRWMAALPAQLDVFLAELSTIASGGANAFPYIFDTSTSDSDPGVGKLRLSSINQNTATTIRLDPVTSANGNIAQLLASVLTGTSGVKGSLRLQKRGDPTRWLIFDITTGANPTGYFNFSLIPRASSGTSPFVAGDNIMVYIDKAGDKGDVGNALKKVQVAPAPVNGVVTVDYNNGACLVWTPAAGTSTLRIENWPPAGTMGEFWIEGTNMGEAGKTVNTNFPVNWVRPDGTFANNASITTNHGAALRPTGVDYVLLWGRGGVPGAGKVVR